MKKHVLFVATLLALGTAFVSCSKDEVVNNNTGVETPVAEGEQEIILQVANTGDGLETRVGRPLYSAEAKQNIDNVYVVIVGLDEGANKDKIVAVKSFENWNSISSEYSTNGHGRQATWKLSKDELLDNGNYLVYGIGYSNDSKYKDGIDLLKSLKPNVNTFAKFKATISTIAAEEFFAGQIAQIEVKDGEISLTAGSTNNVLTLHRQVTGVMGYYINIPTFALGRQADILNSLDDGTHGANNKILYDNTVKALKLRLVASDCNNTVVGAAFNSEFTTTGNDVKYIVNGFDDNNSIQKEGKFEGSTENDAYIVYEIAVKDWFPNGDVNYDGYLGDGDANTGTDNWGKPASIGNYEVGFQPGSVFGGEFMIPVAKVAGKRTLQLQLIGQNLKVEENSGSELKVDGEGNAILRSWNINLPSSDPQIGDAAVNQNFVYVVTSSDPYEPVAETTNVEEETSYSLVRNHLYSVGEKGTDKWDPDTDEPQDLSKGQSLILKVNDNWELIHKMEVE